jgi:uncharacterized protein (TIGR02217 family)
MHIATRLSDEVELGAVWRGRMQLEIIRTDSGFEDRSRLWSQFLREFEITYPLMERNGQPSNALQQVYNAFYASGGGEDSFDFQDWRDYTVTDGAFGIGDGAETEFELVKVYTYGSREHQRRIYRPVSGSVSIKADGVTVAPADYAVDYDLGIITFDVAPLNAVELTWSGEFNVPVRFDQEIQSSAPTTEHEKYDTFTLYEVRLREADFA